VGTYLSYQINHEMPEWRDEHRGLLYRIPNMGTVFKKTFFDPMKGRLVSDVIQHPDFAVNQGTSSMEELRDFTHILPVRNNDIVSYQRAGLWLDDDLVLDEATEDTDAEHHDSPNTFLEQQCFYDIDGDGYEEPYTITVHEGTGKVVRIIPRFRMQDILVTDPGPQPVTVDTLHGKLSDDFGPIDTWDGEGHKHKEGLYQPDITRKIIKITPENNLTAYRFMPSADGTFLGVGYYQLMSALVEAVNTGVNLLFDAGALANQQGGWLAKGMRRKLGNDRFKPGEYKQTNISAGDLQQGIRDINFKEPSPTLLTLITGYLKGEISDLSASADLSEVVGTNTAASTVLMMIEEAQSSTTSLMAEMARSMGKEFQVMFRLNAIFADPQAYKTVLDQEADYKADFGQADLDILPTANPEIANKTQRIQQAQILQEQYDRLVSAGGDPYALSMRFLDDMGIDNPEELLPPRTEEFQQQQMATSQAQQKKAVAEERFFNAQATVLDATAQEATAKAQALIEELPVKLKKLEAEVIKLLEQAESEHAENLITMYTSELAQVRESLETIGAADELQRARLADQPQQLTYNPMSGDLSAVS